MKANVVWNSDTRMHSHTRYIQALAYLSAQRKAGKGMSVQVWNDWIPRGRSLKFVFGGCGTAKHEAHVKKLADKVVETKAGDTRYHFYAVPNVDRRKQLDLFIAALSKERQAQRKSRATLPAQRFLRTHQAEFPMLCVGDVNRK